MVLFMYIKILAEQNRLTELSTSKRRRLQILHGILLPVKELVERVIATSTSTGRGFLEILTAFGFCGTEVFLAFSVIKAKAILEPLFLFSILYTYASFSLGH